MRCSCPFSQIVVHHIGTCECVDPVPNHHNVPALTARSTYADCICPGTSIPVLYGEQCHCVGDHFKRKASSRGVLVCSRGACFNTSGIAPDKFLSSHTLKRDAFIHNEVRDQLPEMTGHGSNLMSFKSESSTTKRPIPEGRQCYGGCPKDSLPAFSADGKTCKCRIIFVNKADTHPRDVWTDSDSLMCIESCKKEHRSQEEKRKCPVC